MKLTGKWTPEERIAVATAALVFAIEDTQAGRIREIPEMYGCIARVLQILNGPANELVGYVKVSQALLDAASVIKVPCLCDKCSAGTQHN